MYDLLIRNARLLDGTGSPWYYGDLAVKDGIIAAMGALRGESARETVDAEGLYLAPGFIDIHSHSDTSILDCRRSESRIFQGVTTEVGGNCGMSVAPVAPETLDLLRDYMGPMPYDWVDMAQFLDRVEQGGHSANFACLAGHGTLRIAVMGFSDARATQAQCDAMRKLGEQAMAQGAFGISSGLIYPPGSFSDTHELAEVARAVVPFGGLYTTHMRNEGLRLVPSLEEALETARLSGAKLQISHHKCVAKQDWQVSVRTTIAMLQRARRQGVDVFCDQYPYSASATSITSNFPDWGFAGGMEALLDRLRDPETRARLCAESDEGHIGRWGDIYVSDTACAEDAWMIGKNLVEIGQQTGQPPVQALADLVIRARGMADEVNYGMCEEDIETIMAQPFVMPGSDGKAYSLSQPGKPHPRNYGTFVRVLARYCRDRALFPVEEAVRKMTSLPAGRLGLHDRGLLRPGMRADLVLFDLAALDDTPSYDKPQQACRGIERVWVNGVLTAQRGEHTGALAGMTLRKGINC